MRTRFITISVVLITICAVSTNQIGHTQTGRVPGVLRPEKSAAKDSGPSADDGPKSRMRLADVLTANANGTQTSQNIYRLAL